MFSSFSGVAAASSPSSPSCYSARRRGRDGDLADTGASQCAHPELLQVPGFVKVTEDVGTENGQSPELHAISMLACRDCLWRCLRAVCPDLPARRFRSQALDSRFPSPQIRARYASTLARDGVPSSLDAASTNTTKEEQRQSDLHAKRFESRSPSMVRHVRLEMPWLEGDRMKLLTRTKQLLADGDGTKALELVRLMSKTQEATISWNAILEDLLKAKKVQEAFKVYNDMKKRGQLPDSHTYMHLFKGLGENAKIAGVSKRAVALWKSLSNPNSKVKPSILLTNAALKACARAGDNDGLWSIAGAIPEEGENVADSVTYTTILNAMKFNVHSEPGAEITIEQEKALDTAVAQGRQIWADVVARWSAGKLKLDEILVCAMGRLLLESRNEQDWDDVLSLLAQTMNIPRQAAVLQLRKRRPKPREEEDVSASDAGEAEAPPLVDQNVFAIEEKKRNSQGWVQPTSITLSLLGEACQKMYLKEPLEDYWNIITSRTGFNVTPDSASLHTRLRFLRQLRASADALELVRDDMREIEPAAKTYRLALSTCERNQLSPRAVKQATELVQLMLERLNYADLVASNSYMKLVLNSPLEADTYTAVQLLTPKQLRLPSLLTDAASRPLLLEFAKMMVSGFDRVIAGNQARMVDKESSSKETSAEANVASAPNRSEIQELQKMKAVWTQAVQQLMPHGGKQRSVDRVWAARSPEKPGAAQQLMVEDEDGRDARRNTGLRDRYARKQQRDQIRQKKMLLFNAASAKSSKRKAFDAASAESSKRKAEGFSKLPSEV